MERKEGKGKSRGGGGNHKGGNVGRKEDGIECGKKKSLENHPINSNNSLTTINIYSGIRIKLERAPVYFST